VSVDSGVPLNELHCPTCGVQFEDFRLHVESEVFNVDHVLSEIKPVPSPWWRFLLCPNGHKWSVKVIWRSRNQPDKVLLDKYLGTA
jgi:hypothetical protein